MKTEFHEKLAKKVKTYAKHSLFFRNSPPMARTSKTFRNSERIRNEMV